jgi:hypothetical protein
VAVKSRHCIYFRGVIKMPKDTNIQAQIIERVDETKYVIEVLSGSLPIKGSYIEILSESTSYRKELMSLIYLLFEFMAKFWRAFPSQYWPLFSDNMSSHAEKEAVKAVVKEELASRIWEILTKSQKNTILQTYALQLSKGKELPSGAISLSMLTGEQLKSLFNAIIELIATADWLNDCANCFEHFELDWDMARDALGKDKKMLTAFEEACREHLSGM